MKRSATLLALSLLAVLAGCSSRKEPAQEAVTGLETSLEQIRPEARSYAPGPLDAVDERMAALHRDMDEEHYSAVVEQAPEVQKQIDQLKSTVQARRQDAEQANARATEAWNGFVAEMPRYLDTLQKRLDQLVKTRKVPKGTSEESLLLDNVRNLWADANNLFRIGKPTEAVARAEEARARARELAQKLGAALE